MEEVIKRSEKQNIKERNIPGMEYCDGKEVTWTITETILHQYYDTEHYVRGRWKKNKYNRTIPHSVLIAKTKFGDVEIKYRVDDTSDNGQDSITIDGTPISSGVIYPKLHIHQSCYVHHSMNDTWDDWNSEIIKEGIKIYEDNVNEHLSWVASYASSVM